MILQNTWGLLALLAVPVIIILYLLKQKHEEYITSSLRLWQTALQDVEANAPWQKLKRNILMFLQIAAIVLLALILSEPFLRGGGKSGGAAMIVIDCSLSMQSTDIQPSRFEAAKKDALKLVEASSPGTSFSLIASDSKPYIVLHKVDDKNRVIQEIKNLRVTDTAEDPDRTVELVDMLIREDPEILTSWFGDGVRPALGDTASYFSYNRNGDNYAVTLLTQRKHQSGQTMTVLSRIANFSLREAELDVSLYSDGNFVDARRVSVDAGKIESVYWTDIPESSSKLECTIDTEDVLKKDNTAGVINHTNKTARVLLATKKNIFLEKVLGLLPSLELFRTDIEDMDEFIGYDLYIFDGEMPEVLPEDGHVILFNPPENKYFSFAGLSEQTEIRSTKHRLYNNLKQEISFGAFKTNLIQLPEWGNPLMENGDGITAFEGYLGSNRIMAFGFDLHETNLPVQPFFPVIMTRAVQELLPGGADAISAVNAGESIELSVDPEAREVFVITPDSGKIMIAPPFPVTAFNGTEQIGTYIIEQQLEKETLSQQFFVNAPSEREFALSQKNTGVQQNHNMEPSGRPPLGWNLKMPLLWILLAILLIEWWVYANGSAV